MRTEGLHGRALNFFRHGCVRMARKKVANGQPAGSPKLGSKRFPTASTILTARTALYMDIAGRTEAVGKPALNKACSSKLRSPVS